MMPSTADELRLLATRQRMQARKIQALAPFAPQLSPLVVIELLAQYIGTLTAFGAALDQLADKTEVLDGLGVEDA
jgi:hypothetical protein